MPRLLLKPRPPKPSAQPAKRKKPRAFTSQQATCSPRESSGSYAHAEAEIEEEAAQARAIRAAAELARKAAVDRIEAARRAEAVAAAEAAAKREAREMAEAHASALAPGAAISGVGNVRRRYAAGPQPIAGDGRRNF